MSTVNEHLTKLNALVVEANTTANKLRKDVINLTRFASGMVIENNKLREAAANAGLTGEQDAALLSLEGALEGHVNSLKEIDTMTPDQGDPPRGN